MSRNALARKYRPQTFAELVGQESIARTLENALRQGRIHSAYMFTGTRGVGKTSSARIFAKALNCTNGPTPTPCGACDACIEIAENRSVDVQEIDAASHTKVEETRELMGRVAYAPAKGRYRVFIIDEAHMLSKSSFNALLKTLEEPPPHAIFVLATTEPQKILETVRSRCIEFNFRRIPAPRIADALAAVLQAEDVAFEAAAIDQIAAEADGSMRDALSLTDQVLGFAEGELTAAAVADALGLTGREVPVQLWTAIFQRDPAALSQGFREAYQAGADLRRLGVDLAQVLRELIVARSTETAEGPAARLLPAAENWGLTDLYRMFDRIHGALVELERSPVPDILLETALLRLAVLEPLGPLEDLVAGLGGGGATAGEGGAGTGGPSGRRRPAAEAHPARPASTAAPAGDTGAPDHAGTAAPAAASPAPAAANPAAHRQPGDAAAPEPPAAESTSTEPPADAPAKDASGDPLPILLREMPAVESALRNYARWEAPELTVALPPDQGLLRKMLEDRREEVEILLRRTAGEGARLTVAVDRDAPPAAPSPEQGRPAARPNQGGRPGGSAARGPGAGGGAGAGSGGPDKRALLEDPNMRALLDAFPGAEVEDIRFQQ